MARNANQKAKRAKRDKHKREHEASEAAWTSQAFRAHNREKEKKKRSRMDFEEVKQGINNFHHFAGIGCCIRKPEEWVSKAYSRDKQYLDFVHHCFFKYPVPRFLQVYFLNSYYTDSKTGTENKWRQLAINVGQGASLKKLFKGKLTKKECFLYLTDGDHELDAKQNIWLARFKALGVHRGFARKVVERLFQYREALDITDQDKSVLDWYANHWRDLDTQTYEAITDYVRAQMHVNGWSAKGRTLGSMIKASNEWHIVAQRAKLGEFIQWTPIDIPDWKFEYVDSETKIKKTWKVRQLTDNKQLAHEGRKQRHCVFSYVRQCAAGNTFIFTMEISDGINDDKCLTIEMNRSREVVQAKGRLNRERTQQEKMVLQKWMGESGISDKLRYGWW